MCVMVVMWKDGDGRVGGAGKEVRGVCVCVDILDAVSANNHKKINNIPQYYHFGYFWTLQ